MRSILALAVLLLALLALIGPEGGPTSDCAMEADEVCLGEGRLQVRVRGTRGRELGGGAAGFGFDSNDALDVVVRVEPARLEGTRVEPTASALDGSMVNLAGDAEGTNADRIFIGSLSRQEIWVEVTDLVLDRTRIYHRPAGAGWGLVDVVPRSNDLELQVAMAR